MTQEYIDCGAVVSSRYRYELHREWRGSHNPDNWIWMHADQGVPKSCVFIMLNPSTADGEVDDPTIRKCVGFSRLWKYEKMVVVNLFAYRAVYPKELRIVGDPVGPRNAHHVRAALETAGLVVCAWGGSGGLYRQDQTMMGWLDAVGVEPVCLGLTDAGKPRHPLYLPYSTKPIRFNPPL